jgi:hypothetical protein
MTAAPSVPKSGTNRAASRSARGGAPERGARGGRAAGTNRGAGGKELMIAAGGIVLLVVLVAFYYFKNNSDKANVDRIVDERNKIEKDNWKLAKEKMETADSTGRLWCQGAEDISEDKLKAPFMGDDTVYNVVFERKKKDKRGSHEDSKVVTVHEERNSGTIMSLSFSNDTTPEVHMEYAFVENKTVPVVRATRHVNAKEGDPLNTGGSITVLVRAKEDDHFKHAKEPPKPKEGAKEEKAEEKK